MQTIKAHFRRKFQNDRNSSKICISLSQTKTVSQWTNLKHHRFFHVVQSLCVCVCVCVCIYIYIYIYTHTHTYIFHYFYIFYFKQCLKYIFLGCEKKEKKEYMYLFISQIYSCFMYYIIVCSLFM